jgi:hypothetical protein
MKCPPCPPITFAVKIRAHAIALVAVIKVCSKLGITGHLEFVHFSFYHQMMSRGSIVLCAREEEQLTSYAILRTGFQ